LNWKFTRQDLAKLLAKLENQPPTWLRDTRRY
jgi:hypothetical protein